MCNKQIVVMKKFFRMVMALSLVGGAFAFTGCTDYEDDINKLNDRLDALETGKIADVESQLASLESSIKSANDAIDAIEALGLDELKTTVEALEAKVAAIDLSKYATLDYVNGTFATKDDVADLQTSLGALEDKVSALEGKYDSDVKISEILAKIKTAQDDASTALGEIQSLKDALGVYATAGKLEEALGDKLNVADFDAKFDEALKAALANDGNVTGEIAKAIQDAVSEFNALFAGRVTSVSLIPELYVDGIPAIEIKSLSYKPITITSTDKEESLKISGTVATTSASASTVRYHVSPDGITNDDFDTPSYVIESAKVVNTRAAVDKDLLSVTEAKMVDGELQVTVKKASGISLDPESADEIYTAALRVPIAEKNLVEGEESAEVYSEYSRLYETTVTPLIAALIDYNAGKEKPEYTCENGNHAHFYSYDEVLPASVKPSNAQVYNKPLDLLAMVTGCYTTDKAYELDKDALKASGLAFRFAVPAKPYITDGTTTGTDQQKFAKVEGNTLVATLPDGETNNAAAVDKTPIVRVSLVDTVANKVVDVRYFKIAWTDVKTDPVEITIDPFEYVLSCENFVQEFKWSDMITKVLAHVGEDGISHNEFIQMFDTDAMEVTTTDKNLHNAPRTVGAGEVTGNFDSSVSESAAALTWTLTTEQIGNVVEDILNGDKISYNVTVTFPGANDYIGDLAVKFSVNVVLPELPSIHGFTELNWDDFGKLARIYPIQYKSASQTEPTAVYAYDLNTLFNANEDGLFVDNILTDDEDLEDAWACRKWDIQFSLDQTLDYRPGFYTGLTAGGVDYMLCANEDNNGAGYHLWNGTDDAATLYPNDGKGAGIQNWFNTAVPDFELRLSENEEGISLLNYNMKKDEAVAAAAAGELKTVRLDVWGRINTYNAYKVHSFDVWFVNPLTINAKLEDKFIDLKIDGSEVDATKAFKGNVKDYAGYDVAVYSGGKDLAEELRVYYGIGENPVWNVDQALISLVKDGNGNMVINNDLDINSAEDRAKMQVVNSMSVNKSLSVTPDQKTLVFKNEFGWAVTGDVNIYVPATISHKWGVETFWVKIVLQPAEVTTNSVK